MILMVRLSTMWDVPSVGNRPLAQILLQMYVLLWKKTQIVRSGKKTHTRMRAHTFIKACVQYSISHNLWSSVSSVKVYCGRIQLIKHLGQRVTVSHLKDL